MLQWYPPNLNYPFNHPAKSNVCMGQSGFVFMFVENLLIENLSFTNCGTLLSSNQSSALHFDDVTNLTISRVVVQNTTGFGILGLSLRGDSRIFESALLYNHGDENREGGNVLLTLADCDSSRSSKSISLHIWSTYFLHGDSPQLDFPTGLTVKILGNLCTNTYFILDNVTVSQNMNGNLGIALSYSDRSSVSVTIENSRFEGGTGGDYIRMDDFSQLQLQDCPNPQTSNQKRMLRIFNTTVSKNTHQGFKIHVHSKCTDFNIEIDQVTFSENNSTTRGFQTGAGVIPGGGGAFRLQGTLSLKVCPRQSIDHKNIS